MLAGCVSWASKMHLFVFLNPEAENVAAPTVVCKRALLRRVFSDVGGKLMGALPLRCDYQWAGNEMSTPKPKHGAVLWHLIRGPICMDHQ